MLIRRTTTTNNSQESKDQDIREGLNGAEAGATGTKLKLVVLTSPDVTAAGQDKDETEVQSPDQD